MSRVQNHTTEKESISLLIRDILDDAETLVSQQFAMLKLEVKEELHQAKTAMLPLAVGIGVALFGVALFGFMFAHLLHTITPLDLWACFGLVAVACVGGGAALFFWGKHRIDKATPIADESVDALKENVKWLMKSK